jgi:hypothetical protein
MKKFLGALVLLCASSLHAQSANTADPMNQFATPLNGSLTLGSSFTSVGITSTIGELAIGNSPLAAPGGNFTFDWVAASAPSVDNSVLVSISNLWTRKLMTSCSGATDALTFNTTTHVFGCNVAMGGGGGGAPTTSTYITEVAEAGLSAEFALGSLGTGLLKNTTTTGVPSIYGGATCTNQFVRSLDASGAATCGSILNTDITATTIDLTAKVTGLLPFANIANGNALTLFGRSANSAGVQAGIAAGAASDCVFHELTSALECGTVRTAGIAASAVTYAKVQNAAVGLTVVGRSANSTGVLAEIAATAASGAVLRESASVLGFGTVASAGIANAAVTLAKIANAAANNRLLGSGAAGSGAAYTELTFARNLSMATTVLSGPTMTKTISVVSPGAAENDTIFYTPTAITITEVRCVLVGSSTPSVTPNVKYGTDRSAAGTSVTTAPAAVTSVTTGTAVTLNNTAPAAGSFIWLTTSAQSGTVTEMSVTVTFTEP